MSDHNGRASLRNALSRRALIRATGAAAAVSALPLRRSLAATDNGLLDAAPEAPYESPITPERAAFLKTKPYRGKTINILAEKGSVGEGLKHHVAHWEEETGGRISVADVPIDILYTQIFSDLTSGLHRNDAYMTAAWFYGDFFTTGTPYILPIEPFLADRRFPHWNPDNFIPAMKRLYTWGGKLYGVLFDADAQTLYYRKDVFANPDNQAKFKAKHGYDLPAPPTTMQQMHDLADFFTGWDWNGDGSPDWGLALHAKVNAQGFFHFLTLAAPYICSPDNKYFYFHPETMKPLINSPGHLRALEDYIKFLPNGPREEIAWTLGQGWNLFLTGKAVMEATWGDLPTLAQNTTTSVVQGKIGAAPIPGVPEAYDPIKGSWTKYPLNQAGNVNGGSWHCVISRFTQEKEATYDFLAFMANRKNAFFNVTHGFTGVQPGMRDEYLPPAGTATLAEWHEQGWNEDDAKAFMEAYYANLALPVQEPYLRIPGAADYWHQLDIRLSALLAGQTTPQKALDETAAAWEEITNRYGRDQQKALYIASFSA
ncbi:MAG: extracellular solute-binding protein [Acetobacteraceae bacterium]|jgi:multiple sugar transport system substrate-binding protein